MKRTLAILVLAAASGCILDESPQIASELVQAGLAKRLAPSPKATYYRPLRVEISGPATPVPAEPLRSATPKP